MTNCFLFAAFKNVPPVLGFFFFLKVKCVTSVYVFEFILLEFVEILGGIDSCLSSNSNRINSKTYTLVTHLTFKKKKNLKLEGHS